MSPIATMRRNMVARLENWMDAMQDVRIPVIASMYFKKEEGFYWTCISPFCNDRYSDNVQKTDPTYHGGECEDCGTRYPREIFYKNTGTEIDPRLPICEYSDRYTGNRKHYEFE